MARQRRRYIVETQPAPITTQEMEVKEVVEVNRDDNTITLKIVFTNNARIKKNIDLGSLEYQVKWKKLKPGDKVKVKIRAQTIIDIC